MKKLLKTEYKQNSSNISGASKVHIHTVRQKDDIQKPLFQIQRGLKICKSGQNLKTDFSQSQYFLIYTTYMRK
jgi:hypothetical protein